MLDHRSSHSIQYPITLHCLHDINNAVSFLLILCLLIVKSQTPLEGSVFKDLGSQWSCEAWSIWGLVRCRMYYFIPKEARQKQVH